MIDRHKLRAIHVNYLEAQRAADEQRREARDSAISWILLMAVLCALLWWSIHSKAYVSLLPKQIAARETTQCPSENVRLSAYEYEIQQRRCQAVAAGALEER